MKITIDTNHQTRLPTIPKPKGELQVQWRSLSYAERMELLAKIATVYRQLSERISQ